MSIKTQLQCNDTKSFTRPLAEWVRTHWMWVVSSEKKTVQFSYQLEITPLNDGLCKRNESIYTSMRCVSIFLLILTSTNLQANEERANRLPFERRSRHTRMHTNTHTTFCHTYWIARSNGFTVAHSEMCSRCSRGLAIIRNKNANILEFSAYYWSTMCDGNNAGNVYLARK